MRTRVPRTSHAEFSPPANRPDAVAFARDADRERRRALTDLYARMFASSFVFLRGSANLMTFDLASTATTGWRVQVSGDTPPANFGAFATCERQLVFDLNDFDETLCAPWKWDLKWLATSVMLLGRENGLSPTACTLPLATYAGVCGRALARAHARPEIRRVWRHMLVAAMAWAGHWLVCSYVCGSDRTRSCGLCRRGNAGHVGAS